MQLRAILILLVAILLGGVTVYLVNNYLAREVTVRTDTRTFETRKVVVAASDLESGTRLDELVLRVVDWPANSIPEGSFSSVSTLVTDQPPLVLSKITRGEPILKHRLSPYGARGGLPAKIPEDKRAVTVAVNAVRGVAGFVMPGDYVDLLHTTTLGRRDQQPVTRSILQNTRVLGIDQQSSESETDPKVVNTVTLLVSPHDGQRIVLAAKTGDINLLLRNEFDASIVESEVVTFNELMTEEPERPTRVVQRVRREPPQRRDPQVEVIRGLEVESQTVKDGNESN